MKYQTFLLLLCCLLVIAACNKNNDLHTTASGRVLEFGTNKPIEGAKVYLYGGVPDGNLSNPGAIFETIDSALTLEDGKYSFAFDASPYPILQMSVKKDLYFPLNSGDILIIYRGKDNDLDIILDPFAWLRLHIKNTMPVNSADYISVGNTFFYDLTNPYWGTTVDTTFTGLVRGNDHDYRVIWFVTKNGITQNFVETIYCPAHDTTLFEIFY